MGISTGSDGIICHNIRVRYFPPWFHIPDKALIKPGLSGFQEDHNSGTRIAEIKSS